ncbi:hypothetical protein [Xenorhabdus innexi]|uniref:Uncharacterized protein n=1 Tax=Xenorhabdus innexi TaxID=290109 RepID=A0A1N6MXL9_9GAMM|nr:hypothetical protein [Xenorhabdus innexi]PHM22164.1 hypothetical protein Xinn_04165 [Xenorhabdus innexi]SIP73469.1 conserved hypothetical protein [Xenorhabdus innexi]
MLDKIKEEIIANNFVDEIRMSLSFNEQEYQKLVTSLAKLAEIMSEENTIDKELALYLYSIPQIVHNAYASFDGKENKPEIAMKLEEAWIELDALSIECLS